MKLTIEAESKEIADLVLRLQNRQEVTKTVNLYPEGFDSTLIEVVRRRLKHNENEAVRDIHKAAQKGADYDST